MKISRFDKKGFVLLLILVAFADIVSWYRIAFLSFAFAGTVPRANFLDVGQGDAELMILPGGVKVLTDAGPDGTVLESLETVLGANDRYIDVAIISHPQSDHYNGFNYILDHYQIGAFVYNGRDDAPGTKSWSSLLLKIAVQNTPLITLGKSDKIIVDNSEIDILSPDENFDESGELNDTGLIELIRTPQFKILLTADTGFDVEDSLLAEGIDLRADILKIPHHGSKYASDIAFLKAVNPKIAVIEVGAKNSYGQPAPETLVRIASSTGATVFCTDQDGTIQIWREGDSLRTVREK